MRLRVVTFNVWNTEGDARRPNLINRALKELDPDLVSFQEVVQTREVRMLDRLLDGLGLHATHQVDIQACTPPFAKRYGGSAIASRWPHQPREALDLRMAGAADVPWAALAARVALPDVGEMLFIGATAAWRPAAEAAREQQAVAITDLDSRHRAELPTIIAGDFNATPEAASIRYLTGRQSLHGRSVLYHDAWAVAGEGPGYTWTIDNPHARAGAEQLVRQPHHRSRFDYVLVGSRDGHPRSRAEIQRARLAFDNPVEGVWLSDHFAVVVDLEVSVDRRDSDATKVAT